MTPPTGMALKIPFHPNGMKPPPAVKLLGWNDAISSATTVTAGMVIFHQTATLFVSESHLTPMTLMNENKRHQEGGDDIAGGRHDDLTVDALGQIRKDLVRILERRFDLDRCGRDGAE